MIYKYVPFQTFISIVETQKMYLTRIDNWEDIYEASLLRTLFSRRLEFTTKTTPNQREILIKWILRMLYAQSWTRQSTESDALWRIYAKDGVKIGVHESDVLEAIQKCFNNGTAERIKLLNPVVIKYDNMIPLNSDFRLENMNPDFLRHALTYKRPAFSHESEYRYLVYYESEFAFFMEYLQSILDDKDDVIPKNIINAFIDSKPPVLEYEFPLEKLKEVYYTPFAQKYQVTTFESYCRNRCFDEKNIHYQQSQLYSSDVL